MPVLLGLLACVWQAVLAGHASLAAGTAARAAARAQAIGLDAPAAARAHLPRFLEHGLHVTPHADGAVTVVVRIPTLPGVPDLGHTRATARFEPHGDRRAASRRRAAVQRRRSPSAYERTARRRSS